MAISDRPWAMPGSKTIGNYIIGKNLGQGTFGKVKLGTHILTQENVAIKILEKSKIQDVADVQRVTREINILKQVRHPNIIQMYEIIETPKQLFLVMEHISQGELFEHIVKNKRLKEIEACEYFQQIIAAVEYLHDVGIVHRDLKPENLLIDFDRRVKELMKTACGSPCYAAPEMLSGKRYGGLMADIWSCGIILFAMLCGYLPFEDPNTSALYKKIIAGDFITPKFISPSAKEFLKGLLITDPHQRLTLSQIKEHSWFKMVNNNPFYKHLEPPVGINLSLYYVPVDDKVVEQMIKNEKTNVEEIKKMVSLNEHNHIVAYYFLVLKRNLKIRESSEYDICSPNFKKNILKQKLNEEKPLSARRFRSKQRSERSNDVEEFSIPTESTTETRKSTKIVSGNGGCKISTVSRNMFVNFTHMNNINKSENKIRDDCFEFKTDPFIGHIDTVTRMSQKKRKINLSTNNKCKRETICNPYEVEEKFKTKINFATDHHHQTLNLKSFGGISERSNGSGSSRIPITFRSSMGRYESRERKPRNISLEISNNDPEYHAYKPNAIEKEKEKLNKTFVRRKSKKSVPKWCDEKERIKEIMNKTVIGFGNQTNRFNISHN